MTSYMELVRIFFEALDQPQPIIFWDFRQGAYENRGRGLPEPIGNRVKTFSYIFAVIILAVIIFI